MSFTSNGRSPLIDPAAVHLRCGLFAVGFGCHRVRRVLSVLDQAAQPRHLAISIFGLRPLMHLDVRDHRADKRYKQELTTIAARMM